MDTLKSFPAQSTVDFKILFVLPLCYHNIYVYNKTINLKPLFSKITKQKKQTLLL